MKRYGDGKHGLFPNAIGAASMSVNMVVLGMMTYYLTTQTGLSGTVVGTILLVSRIFDGVSDLIAGYIIDRCHFKLGKARPFDLFGIPMWIFLVACFAVPQLNTVGKIIYVFLMYNLCQTVSYTFVSVAASIRLKRSFVEDKRANAIALGGIMSAVLATAAGILLPILINSLEYQPNGWLIIALCFAIPGILMNLCQFFLVPEMEPTKAEEEKAGAVSIKDFASALFQNKYSLMIIIVTIAGTMANGIIGNTGTFFYKYVVGDLTLSSLIGTISLVAYLFLIFLPMITKKFGNRAAMLVSFALIVVGSIGKLLNPHSILVLSVCGILVATGTAFCGSVAGLVLIDIMKYGTLKTGKVNDGVYSAIRGFSDKVANGLAPFLVGVLLDVGGFNGALEVQTAGANNAILLLSVLGPAIIAAIGFVTMFFCRMEKDIKEMEAAQQIEEA